ncbi:ubiquitin-related domain-containing protein [Triangularia verruculosa]|uniref:Ubiquitin-related domain-containing protein n=1 Tax=Triangularia verruculosa TaxID=2587418 RepID=A0AAN7AY57_9PEZI|nr:ubiquitin-related domain-containing protein [Triangularia verruculosa]
MADVKPETSTAPPPPLSEQEQQPQQEEPEQSTETGTSKVVECPEITVALSSADATPSSPTEPTPKGKDKNEEAPPPPSSALEKATLTAAPAKNDDSLSIEPTSALPPPAMSDSVSPSAPVCTITLLLPTGARHPYKIDEKYLSKRGVDIPEYLEDGGVKDPFSISVYKLKELILREWRDEWDGKPASPSSIRLIHFGKLLDDKEPLKKYQLSKDAPNVVHMSVRPAEMMEEDEGTKGGKASSREGRTREGGGGCCVIL